MRVSRTVVPSRQMLPEHLVRMANQIAAFWAPYPEADAVEGVRDHLAKFWDPHMRTQLIAIEASSSHTLHSLVVLAVAQLKAGAHA